MSFESLLGSEGRCSFIGRARRAFESCGMTARQVEDCMSLAMRYSFAHGGDALARVPDIAFDAMQAISARSLAGCISGASCTVPEAMSGAKTGSDEHWLTKISTSLGLDAWIDDSLDKWYVDSTHPLFDVLVQMCRRRVMPALLSCMETGVGIDAHALVEQITSDLLKKFPVLGRFSRHLPRAILGIIESHVTGEPLSGHEPAMAVPAGAGELEPVQQEMHGMG